MNWIKASAGPAGEDGGIASNARAVTLLILAFMLGIVVWGLYHTNPVGVDSRGLALVNAVLLAAALGAGFAVAAWLYPDAAIAKVRDKGIATYLTLMAGGSAFMIVVAVGGVIRNFFLFPLEKRARPGR